MKNKDEEEKVKRGSKPRSMSNSKGEASSSDELPNEEKFNYKVNGSTHNKAMDLVKNAIIKKYNQAFDRMKTLNSKAKQRIQREPIWEWEEDDPEHDALKDKKLRILSLTWNMNAKKPDIDMSELLRPDIKHDIISIGSEECLKTIFKSMFGANKRKWVKQIQECLGPEYGIVSSHSLVGIHLVVFALIRIIPLINNIQSSHVATGVWNSLGNKGGVGVSFNVGNTSLIFINCHLASGDDDIRDERRTQDFHKIDFKMKLPTRFSVREKTEESKEDLNRVSNRFD